MRFASKISNILQNFSKNFFEVISLFKSISDRDVAANFGRCMSVKKIERSITVQGWPLSIFNGCSATETDSVFSPDKNLPQKVIKQIPSAGDLEYGLILNGVPKGTSIT